MIDILPTVKTALEAVGLPVIHETVLTSNTTPPCISYMEIGNGSRATGDTIGWSDSVFMVKVWAARLEAVLEYRAAVDTVMRQLGFVRTASNTMGDGQTMIYSEVMRFECTTYEIF